MAIETSNTSRLGDTRQIPEEFSFVLDNSETKAAKLFYKVLKKDPQMDRSDVVKASTSSFIMAQTRSSAALPLSHSVSEVANIDSGFPSQKHVMFARTSRLLQVINRSEDDIDDLNDPQEGTSLHFQIPTQKQRNDAMELIRSHTSDQHNQNVTLIPDKSQIKESKN